MATISFDIPNPLFSRLLAALGYSEYLADPTDNPALGPVAWFERYHKISWREITVAYEREVSRRSFSPSPFDIP